jgi:hypothetical protein
MGVMCKFDIVDYSVNGECGGSRGSGVKGRGRKGGEDGERRREEKGQKKSWGRERKVGQERAKQICIWTKRKKEIGTMDYSTKKMREKKESKNKDKKIIVIKIKILN